MLSLKSAVEAKNPGQSTMVYSRPVRVVCLEKKQLDNNNVELALADNSMAVKAVCNSSAVADKLDINQSVIIRNFKTGRSVLLLDKKTVVTKCAQLDISPDIISQATYLLNPVLPPKQNITDVLAGVLSTSPTKLTTVVGVIDHVCLTLSNS